MRKSLKLKRAFKWLAVAAIAPIVLFFLLAIVIYLPPVQQMVKDEVTARLSRDMGMDISISRPWKEPIHLLRPVPCAWR